MIDTLGSKYARFFLVFPVNAYNFCVYIYIYTLVPWILRIVKTKNQQLLFERKITHQAKKKNNHQKCICQPNKFVFSSCDLTQLRATYWLLVEIITLPLTVNLENDQKLKSKANDRLTGEAMESTSDWPTKILNRKYIQNMFPCYVRLLEFRGIPKLDNHLGEYQRAAAKSIRNQSL